MAKLGLFLKIREKIVKIDKTKKYLKSVAEIGSSLPLYIWIVCTTPELVCGGGDKGIETPCSVHFIVYRSFLHVL